MPLFDQVVDLTDNLGNLQGEVVRLKERNQQLISQLSSWAQVFKKRDINPDVELAGVPPLDGIVTAVRPNKLVEISLGSDDGLQIGHTVQIYRGQSYLGRAQIINVSPDRSVGQLDPEMKRGPVQKDDRVSTKLKIG